MFSWLSLAILATPVAPDALDCRLQDGGAWGPGERDVSAVVCRGRTGFFVPSLEYRSIIDVEKSEPYRLLEEELHVADAQLAELRLAVSAGDKATEGWEQLAESRGVQRDDALKEVVELKVERDERWSPLTWMAVGAGVLLVVEVVALVAAERAGLFE